MLRLTEVLLFIAPFAVFVLWRVTAAQGGPPPIVLAAASFGVVLLAAWLVWFALTNGTTQRGEYVPAQFQNGEIVPGHTARP